jgi:diadenosine tetraphosphate (Ap4A) HIT family hydrolase
LGCDERRAKRDSRVICSPHEYFERACQDRIASNRAHKAQQWIFELIAGRIDSSETVFIDRAEWMLVLNNRPAAPPVERRYLVIFKDTALHSLRHLHAGHVALLETVEDTVRAFLADEHPQRHREFLCYFHYMPSVFQLHMHVSIAKATDTGRVHPLGLVRRNLRVKSRWYREALMLCPAHRPPRQSPAPAAPCAAPAQRKHVFSGIASFRASTKAAPPIFNSAHICTCPTTRRT